jgi:diaminopimelate epimerase
MTIHFTKMHGLGNDFMVINGIEQRLNLEKNQIAAWGKRDTGVGFDQLLLVEKSLNPAFDFHYRIFNADGQEVGQCGNGARCLALFVKKTKLTTKNIIKVYTHTAQLTLHINPDDSVSVDMGIPKLDPKDIPLLATQQAVTYTLDLPNNSCLLHAIQVGNPHAVLKVEEVRLAPVTTIGQQISIHSQFPEQVNVSFMEICDKHHIKLRVYERGCGETQACGSAAVAAAAIGRLYYDLATDIRVSLPGGDLLIQWPTIDSAVILTGPACFVYEGNIEL